MSRTLRNKPEVHKILVIDEIDSFETHEKAFLILMKNLLKSCRNTSIIGIANSVDLPFKKKSSALAMRDTQLLFEPYSTDQLVSILEQKINLKYFKFPARVRTLREIFFNLVDERALELVALKVSKLNGDVRVAFDIIKAALSKVNKSVKEGFPMIEDSKIRVTTSTILEVCEEKYGSKIKETLKALPR